MDKVVKENQYMRCWIEDGIIHAIFKPEVLDLEAAKECVKLRLELSEGLTYPFMADGRGVQNITKEARDYFASDIGVRGVAASALLTESVAGKFIGNFFLQINKPKVPVRLFTNDTDAVNWLKNFVKKL